MMAYEVVGLCEDNKRTYESVLGTYSKDTGFVLSELALSKDKTTLANRLFQINDWKLKKPEKKLMTLKEIEKALGYEIEIKEDKKTKTPVNDSGSIPAFTKKAESDIVSEEWITREDILNSFLEQLFGSSVMESEC